VGSRVAFFILHSAFCIPHSFQGILPTFCIQRGLRCLRFQIRCWMLDAKNPAPRVLWEIIQRAGHALATLLDHMRVRDPINVRPFGMD
jgi:hypothetical protein